MSKSSSVDADTTWLKDAFIDLQAELKLKLKRATQSIQHSGTKGAVNEDHWIDVFRAYLPNRYEVATGFIIDSRGQRSEQIDIVVFDRHFTPTLLDQQNHRYIPAEAVYAAIECKPHIDKNYLEYASQKAASVRKLHRTSVSISHAGGTFPPKTHFPIVAGLVAAKATWTDGLGASFEENFPSSVPGQLDCVCTLEHGSYDVFDGRRNVMDQDGALIYFLFRLLSKLQSMGSVPAIDWAAYAKTITTQKTGVGIN